MDSTKNHLGMDANENSAGLSSPAIESMLEKQARLSRLFEPPSAITAMLESPAIRMMQEQQDMINNITVPTSAITAFMEQESQLHSMLSPSLLDSISTQQLEFSKAIAASIQIPDMDALSGTLSKFASLLPVEPPVYNLATEMGRALEACIPTQNVLDSLSLALEAFQPKFELIGQAAINLLNTMPKIDSAVLSLAQQASSVLGDISDSFSAGLSALSNAFSQIDISKFYSIADSFNYIRNFEEKNEMLKSFGWFYVSELPEELVDSIYERYGEISQDEVDALIVQHFRNNRCAALKQIVNGWSNLPYYDSRKHVFHEAQVCHSRRSFNASTTLISLHFEGVVTDFVRCRINQPTYRVDKALKRISDLTNDLSLSTMSFRDWIVCSYVLECIDQAFTTNFSPADPDSCPNNSRHKIAHGHATAKETEANSLRRFMFMNELYKLFRCLENEYQLAS